MKNLSVVILFLIVCFTIQGQDLPFTTGNTDYVENGDYWMDRLSYKRAKRAYETGLKRGKGDSIKLIARLAEVNRKLEDHESAERLYKSIPEDQVDPESYAEVLASNQKYDQAAAWSQKSEDLPEARKQGFTKTESFYEDSVGYAVNPVEFNTESSEFGPFLMDDQLWFISDRIEKNGLFKVMDLRNERPFTNIYAFDEEVVPVEGLNNQLHEGPMAYISDQQVLVITTNYPESNRNADKDVSTSVRLAMYKKIDEEWKETENFPFNSREYSVAHPSYDAADRVLYFTSDMPGGKGGKDIYYSKYANGEWSDPVNMNKINTSRDEMFPYYDGATASLYFSSNGYAGLGGLDLYKVSINNPGRVINLGYPVNSSKDDFGLVLDETGKKGYLSSNRKSGQGMDDIYLVSIYKIRMKAKLVDTKTQQPLNGEIKVVDKESGREINHWMENGEVLFEGIEGVEYEIVGTKDGYEKNAVSIVANDHQPVEVPITPRDNVVNAIVINNLSGRLIYRIDENELTLLETEPEKMIIRERLEDIYFDFGKNQADTNTLQGLITLMREYPKLDVKVVAYTDNRGPANFNKILSQERADWVANFLIKNGIGASRVSAVGRGEVKSEDCIKGDPCAEEDHAMNRRAEVFLAPADKASDILASFE